MLLARHHLWPRLDFIEARVGSRTRSWLRRRSGGPMLRASGAAAAIPRDRAELLSRSWTQAAELYLQWVPRDAFWGESRKGGC
jgi:hypothetical protein